MKNRKLMLALPMIAAAGCASDDSVEEVVTPVQTGSTVSARSNRLVDSDISADLDTIRSLYARIEKLNAGGRDNRDYHLTKARHWVDFAFDEYTDNDYSGIADEALAQASGLINAMEKAKPTDTNLPMDTPVVRGSEKIRPDLWAMAESYKGHKGFACASNSLAEFEVQLVWAGHEYNELGWRHAVPNIDRAERLARKSKILAEKCVELQPQQASVVKEKEIVYIEVPSQPKVIEKIITVEKKVIERVEVPVASQAPVVSPIAHTTPVVRPPVINLETQEISKFMPERVHFGRDSAALSPLSRNLLDEVADAMHMARSARIRLEGHTDPRRSVAYNRKLSQRRAENVRRYLVGRGVGNARVEVAAAGESRRVAYGCSPQDHAQNRRVEIILLNNDGSIVQRQVSNRDIKVDSSQPANCGGK